MTITEFKDEVAGYMLRTAASFVDGTTDALLNAINMSRDWLQREHDFEYSRAQVTVTIPAATRAALSTAVASSGYTLEDGVTVKSIEAVMGLDDSGFLQSFDMSGVRNLIARARRAQDLGLYTPRDLAEIDTSGTYPTVVADGQYIFFSPSQETSKDVYLSIYKWYPRYSSTVKTQTGNNDAVSASKLKDADGDFVTAGVEVGDVVTAVVAGTTATVTAVAAGELSLSADIFPSTPLAYSIAHKHQTDFFLDFCEEVLLFKTITILNVFQKEDSRAAITRAMLQDALVSTIAWDEGLVNAAGFDNRGD